MTRSVWTLAFIQWLLGFGLSPVETGVVFQVWACAWQMGYSSVPRFPQLKQYDSALTYPVSYRAQSKACGPAIMLDASARPPASEASGTVGGNDSDHLLC